MKLTILSLIIALGVASASTSLATSSNVLAKINLPNIASQAVKSEDGSLLKLLSERRSLREYSSRELSIEVTAEILWAAAGISSPDGKRTAGSTRNWQSIEIYTVRNDGIYFYNAKENTLDPVATGNYQALTGMQPFVTNAPLNILYVGDKSKMAIDDPTKQYLMLGTDIGLMSQNVYLYATENGLSTVIRGSVNHEPLAKIMNLPPEKEILMAQTIGYPKKETITSETIASPQKKPLVIYYSWSGNTFAAAEIIAEAIGGELLKIEPVEPYPTEYKGCIKVAAAQIKSGTLPELTVKKFDTDNYYPIVIASPNWWGTLPPPVQSFIKSNDLSNKEIALFITNGGGGLQNCAAKLTELITSPACATNVIQGSEVKASKDKITSWAISLPR